MASSRPKASSGRHWSKPTEEGARAPTGLCSACWTSCGVTTIIPMYVSVPPGVCGGARQVPLPAPTMLDTELVVNQTSRSHGL